MSDLITPLSIIPQALKPGEMMRILRRDRPRYPMSAENISSSPEHTQEYIQGDKTLRTIRCSGCGCATHREPMDQQLGAPGVKYENNNTGKGR